MKTVTFTPPEPEPIEVGIAFFEGLFATGENVRTDWKQKPAAERAALVISRAMYAASDTGNKDYLEYLAQEIVKQAHEVDCGDLLRRISQIESERK